MNRAPWTAQVGGENSRRERMGRRKEFSIGMEV